MTLGGFIYVHNGIASDYCFEQAITCLALTCDTVLVADCESTDGTLAKLHEIQRRHPHIKIERMVWRPSPGGVWLREIGNSMIAKLQTEWWFHLQADEVIDPEDASEIRNLPKMLSFGVGRPDTVLMPRWNFWGDPKHVTPKHRVCGSNIVRIARSSVRLAGDGEGALAHPGTVQVQIPIWHYGFLRKGEAFHRKGVLMETSYNGGPNYNPILDRLPSEGISVLKECWPFEECPTISRPHPKMMHQWLKDRGHQP